MWEQDEREKIQEEHERPFGSSHVEDGGGDAQRLDLWMRDLVRNLENVMVWKSREMARRVSERSNPFVYNAEGIRRRETASSLAQKFH
jgi:hypothetical protein